MSPTLKLCLYMRYSLECGRSARQGLRSAPFQDLHELGLFLQRSLIHIESTSFLGFSKVKGYGNLSKSSKELLSIIDRSLKGEPVLEVLCAFELDLIETLESEAEAWAAKLPVYLLLPLILLQLPAFFILLLGPTLVSLSSSL
jgi:hypothetical protein